MNPEIENVPGLSNTDMVADKRLQSASIISDSAVGVPQNIPMTAVDDMQDDLWIGKLREVINKTATDPFLQCQELNKVKAAYLSSRHNRLIRAAEDGS